VCSICRASLLALLCLIANACAGTPAGHPGVERFTADVLLLPDGSIQVNEQINVRTDPASPAAFARRIQSDRTDGFTDVAASIAGGRTDPDGISIESGSSLAVRWRLPPAPGTSHTLELRYRALGAVEIQGMRGTVLWPVLPEDHDEIGTARVSVTLPQGTRVLRPPDIDSTGWEWTRTSNAFVATKTSIASNEAGILHAELALDAVPMIEPRWQTRALLGQQLAPSFIAAGLFILVTGAGILWAIWLRYFRATSTPEDARASERREVAQGLRAAGLVVVALGVGGVAVAYAVLRQLGPWPQAVPASVVLVGLAFVSAGWWLNKKC
jgi:hypothetical protein